MNRKLKSYFYKTGGKIWNVHLEDKRLFLDPQSGSYLFLTGSSEAESSYRISYSTSKYITIPEHNADFTGKPFYENQTAYEWFIFEKENEHDIYIKITDNKYFDLIKATISADAKRINITLHLKNEAQTIPIDPFLQPLGPILFNYTTFYEGGILIHASGVNDGKNGYVFSAVSGTGKSTMAKIWQSTGATVINDDRLMIIPHENKLIMTNTPMPYYQDIYKESIVSGLFLINQSPENYIKRLSDIKAVAGIMTNCIQFLYNKKMVESHLNSITNIVRTCPVFELGFRPDTEITELIKNEFGQ
ncbi:MAG: hypothetical protein GXO47_12210 [Chlorobi bacterium]|nr:hypothetical protein [Chlorobiota bacterium]